MIPSQISRYTVCGCKNGKYNDSVFLSKAHSIKAWKNRSRKWEKMCCWVRCVCGGGGGGGWGTERRRGRDSLLIWSTVRDKVSPHMTLSDWQHISKRAHRIDTATSVNAICCSIHHPHWIMTGTHGTIFVLHTIYVPLWQYMSEKLFKWLIILL